VSKTKIFASCEELIKALKVEYLVDKCQNIEAISDASASVLNRGSQVERHAPSPIFEIRRTTTTTTTTTIFISCPEKFTIKINTCNVKK